MSSEEEVASEDVRNSLMHRVCAKWSQVQRFVERYHPDKPVASDNINISDNNAMSHFRNILKHRQKLIFSETEVKSRSSGTKRQKRES